MSQSQLQHKKIVITIIYKLGSYKSPILHTAPGKPLNVQAKAVYSTEIAVWWQHVPPIHQNGIITTYEVLYHKKISRTSKSVLSGNTSITLRNLEILTTYSITVRAYTDVGPGPESDPPLNITTQPSSTVNQLISTYVAWLATSTGVLIQLRLTGIDDCQIWRVSKPSACRISSSGAGLKLPLNSPTEMEELIK